MVGLENMDIMRLVGKFFATSGIFQVNGTFDGSLVGMTVALTTDFLSTADGQMAVQVRGITFSFYTFPGVKLFHLHSRQSF